MCLSTCVILCHGFVKMCNVQLHIPNVVKFLVVKVFGLEGLASKSLLTSLSFEIEYQHWFTKCLFHLVKAGDQLIGVTAWLL